MCTALIQLSFTYVVKLAVGWLIFEGFAWELDGLKVAASKALAFFVVFAIVGWNEEILLRGYHWQTFASVLTLISTPLRSMLR